MSWLHGRSTRVVLKVWAVVRAINAIGLIFAIASCGGGGGGSGAGANNALSLFAGNAGGAGNVDGTGAEARLNTARGVASDSAGNLYVADIYNNTIRKITPAGVVTTLAGSAGIKGSADGAGVAARFNLPEGVATDSIGNVYVADTGNHTIRKISPGGMVTTLAGIAGAMGSADGTGAAARFYYPRGISTDSAGNVYVADTFNNAIRKITPAGVVATLAGTAGTMGSADGTGAAARFYWPSGVATDSMGNVYVADISNHTIRKITPVGVVTTLAGSAGIAGNTDGTGTAAKFKNPYNVATDNAGNVYVADSGGQTIRTITPAGVVTTLAGLTGVWGSADGTGGTARFYSPSGIATDSSGNVYVSDTNNYAIRKITAAGVVNTLVGVVGMYDSTDGTGAAARFFFPKGVATDSAGNVFVADTYNNTIRKIDPEGAVTTLAGSAWVIGSTDGTGAAARFSYPRSVAADSAGNVYVADTDNNTIRKVTPAGVVTTLAGTAGAMGSTDGTGAAARFSFPEGVATDSAGNVYVADTNNFTIRKITPAGVVTTLAGSANAGPPGSVDGTGAAARFSYPRGVATDSAGNVYVADTDNNTIRKITPAGVVTTLAGTAGVKGSADGTGSAARFDSPREVSADSAGNLYVADSGNSTIRKITPAGVVTTVVGQAGVASFAPGSLPGLLAYPNGVAIYGRTLYVTTNNGIVRVTDVP